MGCLTTSDEHMGLSLEVPTKAMTPQNPVKAEASMFSIPGTSLDFSEAV